LPLSTTLAGAPRNITCTNQQFNATTVSGNLTVPQGRWCDLVDVTVNGNLEMSGSAGVRLDNVTVSGNVIAQGTQDAADPLSADANVICGSTVGRNLLVQDSTAASAWSIGACGGNTVHGNVEFSGNAARGNEISGNTVGGNLNCTANGGVSGKGNTAKKLQGQCASLG
jgi:hypothetical protein